jgi:O-acetyl-ADP-ribose deacetylase (regulator of RNase III)
MIRYTQGNLLDDPAEALVNTVNEVGVMGKGIALMFRERFPENTEAYEQACKAGKVRIGRMLVTRAKSLWGPRWVINFPTKKHWRHPSKLEWIREGLKDLVCVIRKNNIHSVALPPLGCGNGGLQWPQVRGEIEAALAELPDVDVAVYVPTSEYQNAPKREGVEELTPARALIAGLVRRYAVLGFECTNLEVQKLAWFLHRSIRRLRIPDSLNLKFKANKYGPYADALRHLLNGLDGSYLHCERRLADAGPLDLIRFEDSHRDRVESYLRGEPAAAYLPALEETATVIDGFESPLGMELLATVDWLLSESKCEPTVTSVRLGLAKWPGGRASARRKQRLFDDHLLGLAIERLAPWNATNTSDGVARE